MAWWGKAIGGTLGYLIGGPLGALLGAALGHSFDRGAADRLLGQQFGAPGWRERQERVQGAFFTACFGVMGHVAKADGRVSPKEIAVAEALMGRMRLSPKQRSAAIELFNRGKAPDFALDEVLAQFRQVCGRSLNLLRMFLEVQLAAALADGRLDPAEERVLLKIFTGLGFSEGDFHRFMQAAQAAQAFRAGAGPGGGSGPASVDQTAQALQVLGVSREASDAEIKRAYRRLMNQHHPDKLVARGLPPEMEALAKEKVQEISAAYQLLRKARGF